MDNMNAAKEQNAEKVEDHANSHHAAHEPPTSRSNIGPKLGRGWPKDLMPVEFYPYHSAHPSSVEDCFLMFAYQEPASGMIFYPNFQCFEPSNMPWFSLWLVCFAVNKTNMTMDQCAALYRYKYRKSIGGIEYLQGRHLVQLYNFACDGHHDYALEWDEALNPSINIWLIQALRPANLRNFEGTVYCL